MPNEIRVTAGELNGADDWDSRAVGQHLAASMTGTTGAGVRGGVVPAAGSPLQYVLFGGMAGILRAGRYIMPMANPALGAVELLLPSDTVLNHDTANATQPRTDLIIAEVKDVGTSLSFERFRVLKGQAGAGAPVPAVNWETPGDSAVDLGSGRWVALWSVLIPANSSGLGTITDLRTWTAAAGGAVKVTNAAAAAGLPAGTPFHNLALDRPGFVRTGGVSTLATTDQGWSQSQWQPPYNDVGGVILTNTTYGQFTEVTAQFNVSGGQLIAACLLDVELRSCGDFFARIFGQPSSETAGFMEIGKQGRVKLRPQATLAVTSGIVTLRLEVAMFTGSAVVNSAKWLIYHQGDVSPVTT